MKIFHTGTRQQICNKFVIKDPSVNLPLNHKVQSSLLALAHSGGLRKRAVKWSWCVVVVEDPTTTLTCCYTTL